MVGSLKSISTTEASAKTTDAQVPAQTTAPIPAPVSQTQPAAPATATPQIVSNEEWCFKFYNNDGALLQENIPVTYYSDGVIRMSFKDGSYLESSVKDGPLSGNVYAKGDKYIGSYTLYSWSSNAGHGMWNCKDQTEFWLTKI